MDHFVKIQQSSITSIYYWILNVFKLNRFILISLWKFIQSLSHQPFHEIFPDLTADSISTGRRWWCLVEMIQYWLLYCQPTMIITSSPTSFLFEQTNKKIFISTSNSEAFKQKPSFMSCSYILAWNCKKF